MDIHDKIKLIINTLDLTNHSFANKVGVTSSTIDSITLGRLQPDGNRKKTKPGYDLLMSIITIFKINPNYLFDLSEHMFYDEIRNKDEIVALKNNFAKIKMRLERLEQKMHTLQKSKKKHHLIHWWNDNS